MFEFETIGWKVLANPQKSDEHTIGLVTLRRPEALNAIDVQMRVELDILHDQINRDDRLRVIVITGEGRGFSAGGDLRTESGPLGASEGEHDFGNFGAYRLLANYFFNDLRHVVIQRVIRKLEELKRTGITDIETANRWIREVYLPQHNARFAKPAALPETAFVAVEPSLLADREGH